MATANEQEPFVQIRLRSGMPLLSGSAQTMLGRPIPHLSGLADGVWASWSWDGDTLTVSNDRGGFYPLYYAAHADQISISPSIPQLLALGAPPELDEVGLSVFLRLGYFIADHTPFAHIRALPPATTLTWRAGRLHLEQRPSRPQALSIGRQEALVEYDRLFREAVRRRPPQGRYAVPLSGGQDSRHIALELARQGMRPVCVSAQPFQLYGNDESPYARRVAETLGLPFLALEQEGTMVAAELNKNARTNFCADEHAWYLTLARHLQRYYDTVYDGLGGDVLSAGLFLDAERLRLMREGRFKALAETLLSSSETALSRMLPAAAWTRFRRELAVEALAGELGRYADLPSPIAMFYFRNRTRREIALSPYRLLGTNQTVHTPYLDYDLVDFLTSLPAEHFLDHRFHRECVDLAYPKFSGLAYAQSGSKLRPHRRLTNRYVFDLLALLRPLKRGQLLRRGFLLPRLARSLLSPAYGAVFLNWAGPLTCYLLQLESIVGGSQVQHQGSQDAGTPEPVVEAVPEPAREPVP